MELKSNWQIKKILLIMGYEQCLFNINDSYPARGPSYRDIFHRYNIAYQDLVIKYDINNHRFFDYVYINFEDWILNQGSEIADSTESIAYLKRHNLLNDVTHYSTGWTIQPRQTLDNYETQPPMYMINGNEEYINCNPIVFVKQAGGFYRYYCQARFLIAPLKAESNLHILSLTKEKEILINALAQLDANNWEPQNEWIWSDSHYNIKT